ATPPMIMIFIDIVSTLIGRKLN
ncbi:hypothetical protein BMETH_20994034712205, partial [methanotrophic bacterial endosymbiont of Bathymodiolus sp.]